MFFFLLPSTIKNNANTHLALNAAHINASNRKHIINKWPMIYQWIQYYVASLIAIIQQKRYAPWNSNSLKLFRLIWPLIWSETTKNCQHPSVWPQPRIFDNKRDFMRKKPLIWILVKDLIFHERRVFFLFIHKFVSLIHSI